MTRLLAAALWAAALAAAQADGGAALAQADGGGGLDRAFIVGRWTDNEDCSEAVAFDEDGTFVTAAGAEGYWALEDDALTMAGDEGMLTVRIVPVDRDTINVVNPDGSLGRSTRCEGDERGPGFVARDFT